MPKLLTQHPDPVKGGRSERQLSVADQEILERFADRTIREHEARKAASEREESEESDE